MKQIAKDGIGESILNLIAGYMVLFGGSLIMIFWAIIMFSGRPLDSFSPSIIYSIILAVGFSTFIILYYIIYSKILSIVKVIHDKKVLK